jgi:predicted nucleic-acid-binding Zn-ribbon protein
MREVKRLAEWLDAKWTQNKNCPICGQNNWTLNYVTKMPAYNEQPEDDGHLSVMPVGAAVCLTCGHTYLFNAKIAGLRDDSAAQPGGEHRD